MRRRWEKSFFSEEDEALRAEIRVMAKGNHIEGRTRKVITRGEMKRIRRLRLDMSRYVLIDDVMSRPAERPEAKRNFDLVEER